MERHSSTVESFSASDARVRAQARPKKRWEQDLVEFLVTPYNSNPWLLQAGDEQNWMASLKAFVEHAAL